MGVLHTTSHLELPLAVPSVLPRVRGRTRDLRQNFPGGVHWVVILDLGAEKGDFGHSALHVACETGLVSLIRRLVDIGADINAQDTDGCTPLIWACMHGQEAAAHLLLDLGADGKTAKSGAGRSSLHSACKHGLVSLIRRLVDIGADINARDNHGCTPLIQACISGHEAAAHLLLDLGANGKTAEDSWGRSALHLARDKGFVSLIRRLEDDDGASQDQIASGTSSSAQSRR
jgi:ankyrin repeat protein